MTLIELTLGAAAVAGVILVTEVLKRCRRKAPNLLSRLSEDEFAELERAVSSYRADREREQTEAMLAENLKNQQEPIPWHKVPKNPPAPVNLSRTGRASGVSLPWPGGRSSRSQSVKPVRPANTSSQKRHRDNDDLTDYASNIAMANLFNGGDSTSSSSRDSSSSPTD